MDYVAYMQTEANLVAEAIAFAAGRKNIPAVDFASYTSQLVPVMIQVRNHFHAQGVAVPDMVEIPTLRAKRFTL